jgi:hypothetical protein
MPDPGVELVEVLNGFCRALRKNGLAVGTHDSMVFCQAAGTLDPTDMLDLYWAGRTSLVHRHEDLEVYHEIFRRYFLSTMNPVEAMIKVKADPKAQQELGVIAIQVPATDPRNDENDQELDEAPLGFMASSISNVRSKSFTDCSDTELASLRRIMRRLRLRPPLRNTRRPRPASKGRTPDMRRTIGDALRTQGEILEISWRTRRKRHRPVVLILDISGSMADHSRSLLQFAWSSRRASQKVEVFAFGTRLTYVTKALNIRSLDEAMNRAGKEVCDWEGGTRIGLAVSEFVSGWGRRGMARGAIVVICSDGFDRGDPELLADGMEKLARLAHTIVWLTPHARTGETFEASSLGMLVAEPFVDVFGSCHDFKGLEDFAARLPTFA